MQFPIVLKEDDARWLADQASEAADLHEGSDPPLPFSDLEKELSQTSSIQGRRTAHAAYLILEHLADYAEPDLPEYKILHRIALQMLAFLKA